MNIAHGLHVADRPLAVMIGNFDGVHRGHQAMAVRTRAAAEARGLGAAALTFEPHPREVFAADTAPTRITPLREKLRLLSGLGLDRVHVARFTRAFAALAPEAFVDQVLVQTLRARWVLVGADFRFGARRSGDIGLLGTLAAQRGITLEVLDDVMEEGERISSSGVRAALGAGDLARASRLLGRPFRINGRVVHGQKLGRTLGFPTANIQLRFNRPPLLGIYAVRVHGIDATPRDAVASLGFRPTVTHERKASLEVFVFDFAGDLYGRSLDIEFVAKIRDEETYDGLPALKAAIARDCEQALRILRTHAPTRPAMFSHG
jgi:riboflavin kinase/FMN adenylyltransferase